MCVCVLWFVYCCFSLCYCLSLQLSIWIGLINHLIKYNWLRIVASCTTLVGVKTWTYIVLSRAKISLLYFPVFDTLRCERKGSMVIPTSKALIVIALDPYITNSARSITRHELEKLPNVQPLHMNVCSNEQSFTCLESLDYKHEYILES